MTLQELFSSARKWTKGAYARTSKNKRTGATCGSRDARAACWCLEGALLLCYPDAQERTAARRRLLDVIMAESREFCTVFGFNDDPGTKIADIQRVTKAAGV